MTKEIENSVSKRNIVNDYRKIDTIVGTSYTSFLVYVSYEDLDNGTLTIKQLKDNTNLISNISIKVPMNEFKQLIERGTFRNEQKAV